MPSRRFRSSHSGPERSTSATVGHGYASKSFQPWMGPACSSCHERPSRRCPSSAVVSGAAMVVVGKTVFRAIPMRNMSWPRAA